MTEPGYIACGDPLMGPIICWVHRSGLMDVEARCETLMQARITAGRWNREGGYRPSTMPGQYSGLNGMQPETLTTSE